MLRAFCKNQNLNKPARPSLKHHKTRIEVELAQNKEIEKIIKYSQLEKKLKSGDLFGEQALFDWGHRRFSAITNGPCEFLVLRKRDFKFLKENFDEKRKILKKLFEDLIKKAGLIDISYVIGEIASIAEEKAFERGATLTNEGESDDYFYIISEGTCELVKNVRIDETTNLEDTLVPIKQLLRIAPVYNEMITVCMVSKGSFLGEEILFAQQPAKSFCTVRVTSSVATVFAFKKKDFIHKIPLTLRKEIESLFEAKRGHYSQAINTILTNKYPTMRHALNTDGNADVDMLGNLIELVPRKSRNLNLKVRTGIFRGEKRNAACVSARLSLTPEKEGILAKNIVSEIPEREQPSQKVEPNGGRSDKTLFSSSKTPNSSKVIPEIDLLKVQRLTEDGNSKVSGKNRVNSLENLKFKISRTHVNNDTANKTGYVSTTPIPLARNLTERGLTMKRLLIGAMEEGDYTSRNSRELKTEETLLDSERMVGDNTPFDFSDYGKIATPSVANILSNANAVTDQSRVPMTERGGSSTRRRIFKERSEERDKHSNETPEALLEIRRQLLGREADSKGYLMAKKKLELKLHNNMKKSFVETARDLSFGKRLEDLLRPMRGKMQRKFEQALESQANQSNQDSPCTSANIRTITEVNVSFGPIKQHDKSQASMTLDNSPIPLKTSINLQNDSMCKSIQNRSETETLFIEGVNESLDSPYGRKGGNSARKLPEIMPISPQPLPAIKVKKERNTLLEKYKFIRFKNRNLSNGGDYGVDKTNVKKDRDCSSLHIRAHSLMRQQNYDSQG